MIQDDSGHHPGIEGLGLYDVACSRLGFAVGGAGLETV